MGGGGLMQLVAYGAQDIYLSGNPQITFFKVVYRRHTNFSMESIAQTINGTVGFNRKVTATISRNGDLINRMWLEIDLPKLNTDSVYDAWVGHKLVKSVEIEIGGQRIDKHYGDWLQIWNELSQTAGHWAGYKNMVEGANMDADNKITFPHSNDIDGDERNDRVVYVPLQFWFCRNPGLALPLIALQYHEVKVNLEFASLADIAHTQPEMTDGDGDPIPRILAVDSNGSLNGSLYVDYVYLDTDERRRFAQVSHEYLIEQLQFTGDEAPSQSIKMNFNHPVKELVWVETGLTGKVGDYTSTYTKAQITLNSHERMSERKPMYYQLVQPYQHHERVPTQSPINVYSFALKPEEHQPSGTCNMSRIDTATLKLTGIDTSGTDTKSVKIFATNYNVLRIMSGMGGLAYSN
jgi:hypothetical protein|uniref:Major capsid protein N-terminal domain-containing protein n=1 Tax=viral metagenome TaxID=1070528 RepID=A0A6C0BQ87_9ZZZZ